MAVCPVLSNAVPRAVLTAAFCLLLAAAAPPAAAQRFFDDDPLERVPPPMPLDPEKVKSRKLSDYYDFLSNQFATMGERHEKGTLIPAEGVNTLGEVMDGPWFENRHGRRRMSLEALMQGPPALAGPPQEGVWEVIGAKTEGITPGFTIRDPRGVAYMVKFDPVDYPEIGTSADVIGSKIFHAIGFHTPENYIVRFDPDQLKVSATATLRDADGKRRPMTSADLYDILSKVPQTRGEKIRASVSAYLQGRNLGPFRFYGARSDDPNDIVPHERRRDLRGYSVFSAWVGHDDSRAINTLDMLVTENGVHYIKHYLIDFGSIFGSASTGANSPRSGFEPLFAWKPAAVQFFTLGLVVPPYARAGFPNIPAVGRFEWQLFDPVTWVPEYPNAAFRNRLPDDAFWAARIVMAFTDEEIQALVSTGQYTDRAASDWITECLIQRRNKIGRAFFAQVLPLEGFTIGNGRLQFDDLAVRHGFAAPRQYTVSWSRFDNRTAAKSALPEAAGLDIPAPVREASPSQYFVASIHAGDPRMSVEVYLRRKGEGLQIVGIERSWPPR